MSHPRVLIVEDNAMNMELLHDWLEAVGYSVLKAFTAPEGIELAHRELPDIILMDLALPGMDGVEATTRLKADAATRHIPILAVTASSMRVNERQLEEVGCEGVVFKPIDFDELESKMKAALSKGRSEE